MPDGFETLDDAARRLGVHKSTLQRWMQQGALRRWHMPGNPRTLVKIADVERLQKPTPRPSTRPATGVSSTSKTG